MADQATPAHPQEQYSKPQGDKLSIPHPGLTDEMREKPDHGEETYKGFGRLKDKRAIITGGDSGIGRAVAIAFAREGADVLIAYLPDEEKDADETGKYVKDAGRKFVKVPGDIRDEQHCLKIIETAKKELGGIDILVNNAAYQMTVDSILELTTEQFDRTLKTNLYAMFWLSKAAIPVMKPGSTIINTSSIQGFMPNPQLIDYATTKAGIVNFTKALGQQMVERGIRVNSVAPGPIWTPLIPATMPEERVSKFGSSTPMSRAGQPAELAPAFVFFASQESSYITAETLAVTGGKPLT